MRAYLRPTLFLLLCGLLRAWGACTYDVYQGKRWDAVASRVDIVVAEPVANVTACAALCDAEPTCLAYTHNSVGAWCTTSASFLDSAPAFESHGDYSLAFKQSCPEVPSCSFTFIDAYAPWPRLGLLEPFLTSEAQCQSMCTVNENCVLYCYELPNTCFLAEEGVAEANRVGFNIGIKSGCPRPACTYERSLNSAFVSGSLIIRDFPLSEAECQSACDATRCVGYVYDSGAGLCTTQSSSLLGTTGPIANTVAAVKTDCPASPPCLFTEYRWAAVRKSATTDIFVQDVADADNCTAYCSAISHCVGLTLDSSGTPLRCTLHSEVAAGESGDVDYFSFGAKIGCVTNLTPRDMTLPMLLGGRFEEVTLPLGAQYEGPAASMEACLILCFIDGACTQVSLDTTGRCLVYHDAGGSHGLLRGRLMK